ncbi:hypothetical protein MPER_09632, partial [Moniliophthora perniciosa FA553]
MVFALICDTVHSMLRNFNGPSSATPVTVHNNLRKSRARQLQDIKMVRYAAAALATNPEKTSRARGEYLRTHFKNMREVAAALTGLKLSKAYTYLSDVKDHKQVIPFRRFSGGVGRASQAKQFGATQGRWPEKSVRFITRLLKNAESNADAQNIDVEDLGHQEHRRPTGSCSKTADAHTVHTSYNPYRGTMPVESSAARMRGRGSTVLCLGSRGV